MGRSQVSVRVFLGALSAWLAACGLDSELPGRNGSTAPVSSAVTLSGAGTQSDIDASVVTGASSRITDIDRPSGSSGSSGSSAATERMPADTESAGAGGESTEEIGGTAASAGGAAGAGGRHANGGSAGSSPKEPPVLWFSEYVEGSSSNKALEISTKTRSLLDDCKVATYFNGKTEATVVATLSGVLEAGQVLTLCTSTLKEKLPDSCTQVGNLTFNGDDAVALSCSGIILDVIGQIGLDPGEAWGSETNSTTDHTLRRRCSVPSGDPLGDDAFDPSIEWQALPVDSFDGLGARGC